METTPGSVSSSDTPASPPPQKFSLSIDPRWLCLALLAIIVVMLLLWKPWQQTASADARTVSVTGESTVKATPVQFSFYPSYEFKNADKDAAIKAATAKQTELVTKLKALGVADKHIKTSLNGYQDYSGSAVGSAESPTESPVTKPPSGGSGDYTYTLQLTVTVPTSAQAQKVQDYLATTSPQGAVTPQPEFSENLRKKLEAQARDSATRDARGKADQSARNLGFKVGGVKSVDDGSGFNGGVIPMRGMAKDLPAVAPGGTENSLAIQPGENELSYSVTVVYFIK